METCLPYSDTSFSRRFLSEPLYRFPLPHHPFQERRLQINMAFHHVPLMFQAVLQRADLVLPLDTDVLSMCLHNLLSTTAQTGLVLQSAGYFLVISEMDYISLP